jgi:hypothetical protein
MNRLVGQEKSGIASENGVTCEEGEKGQMGCWQAGQKEGGSEQPAGPYICRRRRGPVPTYLPARQLIS